MQINNITVPDAGSSTQYVPDPIGGWMYVVTVTTTVSQERLDSFDKKVTDLQSQLADTQAELDKLTAVKPTIDAAIVQSEQLNVASLTAVPVDTVVSATSTPTT